MKILIALFFSFQAKASWNELSEAEFPAVRAPAPSAKSATHKDDVAEIEKIMKSRTGEECKFALYASEKPIPELFAKQSKLSADEIERAMPVVTKAIKMSIRLVGPMKKNYPRKRPYQENLKIKVCPGIKQSPAPDSYPSGHAVVAFTAGCTFALIYPDRAAELKEWGAHLAHQRVVGGMHYPSDIEASRKIADSICARVQNEGDFKIEAAALKKIDQAK